MGIYKYLKISISIIFSFSFLVFSFSASAQKVLQCSPGMATINNNLTVSGDLTVNNNAAIANDLTVNKDIYAAFGSQKIYLGPDSASPYISNNLNGGEGILFYSNGGQNFLWQSPSGVNPDAMILKAGSGLPSDNGYNLQVFGQVSSYQLHTMGIHLDMQGGIGPVPRPNILKFTNSAATGNGAAIFLGDPGAYDNNSIIFSEYTAGNDIGKVMMTMNTVSGNVGVATVNPQITLALGDNDTGLKWNSDGNFSLYTDNNERVKIDPAGDVTINNQLCLGGVCKNAWPESEGLEIDPTVKMFAKVNLPNCAVTDKLRVIGPEILGCEADLQGTDSQTLSIVGNELSISGGNTVGLPGGASYWTLNGTDIYNNNASEVGIGSNAPAAKLVVDKTGANNAGSPGDTAAIFANSANSALYLEQNNAAGYGIYSSATKNFFSGTVKATNFFASDNVSANTINSTSDVWAGGSLRVDMNTLFVDSVNNRVSIGTVNTDYKLHVGKGGINVDDKLCINGVCKAGWNRNPVSLKKKASCTNGNLCVVPSNDEVFSVYGSNPPIVFDKIDNGLMFNSGITPSSTITCDESNNTCVVLGNGRVFSVYGSNLPRVTGISGVTP